MKSPVFASLMLIVFCLIITVSFQQVHATLATPGGISLSSTGASCSSTVSSTAIAGILGANGEGVGLEFSTNIDPNCRGTWVYTSYNGPSNPGTVYVKLTTQTFIPGAVLLDCTGPCPPIISNTLVFFSPGVYVFTWNGISTTVTITNPSLTITGPPDVRLEAGPGCAAPSSNIGTVTTTGGIAPITISNDAPHSLPLGATTVTWTATDHAGQTARAKQTVTVVDTTPPSIVAPAPITVVANTLSGWTGPVPQATATDACGVTITNNAPAVFPVGITTVTYAASDPSGNSASASTTVIVLPPIVTITTSTSLTSDLSEQIVIGADNIVLNCNGHTIYGVSPVPSALFSGIYINGKHGIMIKNCIVKNFETGFKILSSSRITLLHNFATSNSNNGFFLGRTQYSVLLGNNATSNGFGFQIVASSLNLFAANNSTSNSGGFLLLSSWRNLLLGNDASKNVYPASSQFKEGFGFILTNSSYNILWMNTANNNQAYGFVFNYSSNNNQIIANPACGNGVFDALVDATSTGNNFEKNKFCKTSGLPPPPPPQEN